MEHAVNKFSPSRFIGCSGTFTTLGEINFQWKGAEKNDMITTDSIRDIHFSLLKMNRQERAIIPGMALHRIDLILMGLALVRQVLSIESFSHINTLQTG